MKKEDSNNKFKLKKDFVLFIILLVALVLRLYRINIPLADFHSWRQADTASVAKNFVRHGFDLLKPKYNDISSIQSGLDNPQGYRFVEFPLYNAFFAGLYKLFPIVPLEVYGRATTIFFALIIIAVIYYLLLKESGRIAAFIGSSTYALFPFFVYFSRVILPETMALALTFLAILFLYGSLKGKKTRSFIFEFASALLFALALLIKPTTIFFGITILYLFIKKYKFYFFKKPTFYLYFLISLAPLALWRLYIRQFPEGVPFSEWLITQVNTYKGRENIFLRPAFFRWIFFERIENLILGGYATFFFVLGVISKHKNYFFLSLLVSSLAYLFVFEGGNVQHEYYQTLILPILAMYVGLGVSFIFKNSKAFLSQGLMVFTTLLIFAFSFFISYYHVKDYYNYPKDLVSIANILKDLTKPEDKIITDTTGDTTLLYLADRKGSPAPIVDMKYFKQQGYAYFATVNKERADDEKKKGELKLVFENEKFYLFRL